MARNEPKDRVKAEVEAQAASCRTLASAMRAHGESLGWLQRPEKKLIEGWATMLDGIAEGLMSALRDKETGGLGRFWTLARWTVAPLLAMGGHFADGLAISDHFADNGTVTNIAQDIQVRGDVNMTLVLNWAPDTAAAEPAAIEGSASASLGPMTAEAQGTAGTASITESPDSITATGSVGPDPATAMDEALETHGDAPRPTGVQLQPSSPRRLARMMADTGAMLQSIRDRHELAVAGLLLSEPTLTMSTILSIERGTHRRVDDIFNYAAALAERVRPSSDQPDPDYEAQDDFDKLQDLLTRIRSGWFDDGVDR